MATSSESVITFKFRIKDGTAGKRLVRYATACNQVWNYCVATQREAERRFKAGMNVCWPSAFDLIRLCSDGASVDLGVHSDAIRSVCRQFVASRDLHKRCPRFRASFGPRRSLGWVPFISRNVKVKGVIYLTPSLIFGILSPYSEG
jgi:hypothetical protein